MTFFAFFQNRFMVPICVFLDAKWHLVISLHFKECEFTIFQTKKKIVKIRGGVKVGRRVVPTCWSHSAPTFFDPPPAVKNKYIRGGSKWLTRISINF